MTIKTHLLMTASERAMGRYMRAPDHAEAPAAPAPAPAATEQPAAEPEHGGQEDFSAFEKAVDNPTPPKADESEEADPPASQEGDGDDQEAPASDDQQGAPPEEDEVSKLRADLEKAQRDLEATKSERERERSRELEELRREVAKLKGEDSSDGEVRNEGEAPDPKDYEYGTADSQYLLDMAEWKAEQKFAQREREAQLRQDFNQMEENWKGQISSDDVKARYPDFEEKVIKSAERGDWKLSLEGSLLVRSSPVAADVAYHLASNPAESARIAGLNVMDQALEIGRIEGRYLARQQEASSDTADTKSKALPKAPPPPEHRARGAGGRFAVDAATDDFSAFEKNADKILAGS